MINKKAIKQTNETIVVILFGLFCIAAVIFLVLGIFYLITQISYWFALLIIPLVYALIYLQNLERFK